MRAETRDTDALAMRGTAAKAGRNAAAESMQVRPCKDAAQPVLARDRERTKIRSEAAVQCPYTPASLSGQLVPQNEEGGRRVADKLYSLRGTSTTSSVGGYAVDIHGAQRGNWHLSPVSFIRKVFVRILRQPRNAG